MHQHRNPAGAFRVLDAAGSGDHDWMARALGELLEGEGSLVIRHVDRLSAVRLRALWIALEHAQAAGRQHVLSVAVTLAPSPASGDLAGLLKFFPAAAQLPPLRHHIEDLHELVPFFLAKLNPHDRWPARPRRCSCCCGRPGPATPAALAGPHPGCPPPAQRHHPSR